MSSLELRAKKAYQVGARWLAAAAILTGVGVGGVLAYNWLQNRPAEATQVQFVPVTLGNIENTISEGGTVELGGQRTIKSPEESAVDQILVKLGDRIQQNQVLMTLRNPERETILKKKQLEIQKQEIAIERNRQKVQEAAENLAFIQANYDADLEDYRQEAQSKQTVQELSIQQLEVQIKRNRQKVEEAQENLAAEELELTNQKNLLERGFIARQEVDRQEQIVRESKASLRETDYELNKSLLDLETKKTELIELETSVDSSKVMEAKNNLRQAQSDLQQSLSDLKRLQVEYQEEVLKLENNVVTSSLNGVVLSIKVKPGDGVKLGDNLITFGDPTQELVQLQLSTLNAAEVQPNQPAQISIIGPNAKVFTGRVQQIDLQAGTGSAAQDNNSEQAIVPATVKLDQPTGTLIPGSPVSVEIVLAERKNVVVLETELIQRDGKSTYVWIVDGENKAQKQPVKLGLEGLLQVEVTSGLKPKDRVIQPSPEITLEPGTLVIEKEQTDEPKGEDSKDGGQRQGRRSRKK
ncbi:MAG: efflux RND transporter periplasmic adaptor subunit [Microcoleaceae cyanobacterium]